MVGRAVRRLRELTEDALDELRRHPRQRAVVVVTAGGYSHALHTRDISLGGLFLESDDPLPPGSLFPLSLALPGGPLELTAVVVHTGDGSGMGVRFDPGNERARQRLAEFLGGF